jgi:hypothetical protein
MTNFYATLHGREFKTKKSLREAVAAGEPVNFQHTSYPFARGSCDAGDLRPFDVIVGPDPWTQRNWCAYIRAGNVV